LLLVLRFDTIKYIYIIKGVIKWQI